MANAIPSDVRWFFFLIFAFLHCNSFSHYLASLAETERRRQKIEDSSVLATCQPGTSVMLSSKVKGPVAHERT